MPNQDPPSRDALLALLAEFEWSDGGACPCCDAIPTTLREAAHEVPLHRDGCRLAAALGRPTRPVPPRG